jgi:hypothetical protein
MAGQNNGRADPFSKESKQAIRSTAAFKAAVAKREQSVRESIPGSSYYPDFNVPVIFRPLEWGMKPMGGKPDPKTGKAKEIMGHSYLVKCLITDDTHPGNTKEFTEYYDVWTPKPGKEDQYDFGAARIRGLLRCVIPAEQLTEEDPTADENNWETILDEICEAGSNDKQPLLIRATPISRPGKDYVDPKTKQVKAGRAKRFLDAPEEWLGAAQPQDAQSDDVQAEPEPEPEPVKTVVRTRRAVAAR